MIWGAVVSAVTKLVFAFTTLATSWFGGRKAATADIKVEQAERDLTNALRAKEIEDEVEALDRDALKSRSRKWVRGAND